MIKIDKKLSEKYCRAFKLMDKNNLSEINISDGKNSYKLKKNLTSSESLIKSVEKPLDGEVNKKIVNNKDSALKSPLVGTAYLCPEPGSKAFIEIGQSVKIGQVLLIIEAMKTMNEITADRNGIVKKIFIENETPVEFGEPLVLIE